ncbi:hypothetical protein [Wolbachia endosymbiont (group A) of Agelastica alni]
MKITEYLQFHNKGAGEGCQVSFSFLNALPKVCYARMHSILAIAHRFI